MASTSGDAVLGKERGRMSQYYQPAAIDDAPADRAWRRRSTTIVILLALLAGVLLIGGGAAALYLWGPLGAEARGPSGYVRLIDIQVAPERYANGREVRVRGTVRDSKDIPLTPTRLVAIH